MNLLRTVLVPPLLFQNAKECIETLPGGLCRTCQNGYRKVGERCVKVSHAP